MGEFKDRVRDLWQRITTPEHVSDNDLWNTGSLIGDRVIPILERLKKNTPDGFLFLEGTYEKEQKALDEIINALKILHINDVARIRTRDKYIRDAKKYYGDWEAEIPENKRVSIMVPSKDGSFIFEEPSVVAKEAEEYYGSKWEEMIITIYFNAELWKDIEKRRNKALALLAKKLPGMAY